MGTAKDAKLQYEAGQNAAAMAALTNSGDETTFTSAATLWSGRSGYAPVVRPNGLLTGGAITPDGSGVDDVVDVAALTCNLNGVVTSVAAGEVTISRGLTTDICRITSITVDAAGTLQAVAGADHTAFSEVRGATGGPPLIPVDSIEIGQVRVSSITAAEVAASEIFQVVGLHQERADFPLYDINYGPTIVGGVQTKAGGSVTFLSALPEIHTGPAPKKVFASYSSPIFADISLASDFVPPETSNSVTSTQVYGATIGSAASTLNQGTFTAYLTNGITDALVLLKDANLWFKFYADRYATPYMLTQGVLGIARTFPVADQIQAACTISATVAAVEVAA
ncbi:hypothetical protein [Caudoviricetes sp.]|nr:hypothetical protein [Caudoviricetes sp.]